MAKTMADIKSSKPKAVMSEEHKGLRGDTDNDKPYWSGEMTAEEWEHRKWFETRYSEEDAYSPYVSDLDEIVI